MSRRILITGGASGLGRSLALRYVRAGWRVCITDVNDERGQETLSMLGPADAMYLHADVTRECDLQLVCDRLEQDWGGLDVLVNNAGVAQTGRIEDVPIEDWQWVVDINLIGVVRGCKVFVPMFKRQGQGQIVNIASLAGLIDVPRTAAYNATKAAVVSLSYTLKHELADDGIDVSVVCPSFFQTNLDETMRSPDPTLRTLTKRMLASGKLDADEVADLIYRGVERKRMVILPHPEGKVAWLIKRFSPAWFYAWVIKQSTRRMYRD